MATTTASPAARRPVSGTFQTTFTAPGSHGFYCQVHGSISGGMRGTVVVRDTGTGGGSGPGTIALNPTAYTVNEAAGVVTVTVERAGGSEGKASVKFGTAPGSAKSGKDFTPRKGTLNWDNGDASPKTIEVPLKKDSAAEPDETLRRQAQQGHRRRARRRQRDGDHSRGSARLQRGRRPVRDPGGRV